MLVSQFLEPMNIEISELAETMGVHRNTLSRIPPFFGKFTVAGFEIVRILNANLTHMRRLVRANLKPLVSLKVQLSLDA